MLGHLWKWLIAESLGCSYWCWWVSVSNHYPQSPYPWIPFTPYHWPLWNEIKKDGGPEWLLKSSAHLNTFDLDAPKGPFGHRWCSGFWWRTSITFVVPGMPRWRQNGRNIRIRHWTELDMKCTIGMWYWNVDFNYLRLLIGMVLWFLC